MSLDGAITGWDCGAELVYHWMAPLLGGLIVEVGHYATSLDEYRSRGLSLNRSIAGWVYRWIDLRGYLWVSRLLTLATTTMHTSTGLSLDGAMAQLSLSSDRSIDG